MPPPGSKASFPDDSLEDSLEDSKEEKLSAIDKRIANLKGKLLEISRNFLIENFRWSLK